MFPLHIEHVLLGDILFQCSKLCTFKYLLWEPHTLNGILQ